ncbi:metabotropic glutamate receptor 1-like [Macrosteles quadrilineatus]|uniref:metabotropic glutamate receptor 1-like n=1 Tax=Macrosteles quadrilineatus TaxID=74068 RepID=UPI0023E24256|nr:metabotropic glutamate receptor 1-like [Macrosteles quadrilineatus]
MPLWSWLLLLLPSLGSAPQVDQQQRVSALMDGDFIIGALFSVHHQPKQKRAGNTLVCGEVREMYGIQRIEVTFQTLEAINKDPTILPNVTLGVEIRDSCWYAPVALQQSIEFIRDAISPARDSAACGLPLTVGPSKTRRAPLVGVIGPGSSSVALQVQNLLQLFQIPQVGYSTTSKDLSDKSRFNYFLRVVPSDYYQAQVMVDIVRAHNWTYVSAVNTDENYGQSGIQAFRELAERANICIAKEDSVLSNAEDEVFDNVVKKLDQDQNARVVVCFCEGMTVRGLLAATHRLNLTGRFIFLGSDGWADRSDVADGYEPQAHGSLSIRIHSPYVRSFDNHYFRLNPFNNSRNPWFKEFWQWRFNCSMPGEGESVNLSRPRTCTGTERLSDRYKQDPKLSFVIKAIYTLAYGLHNLQQELCGKDHVGVCPQLFPINGSLFKNYLLNVSFAYRDEDTEETEETVEFDRRGDPPGRYNIMNFQLQEDGTYDYKHVGDWNNGSLHIWKEMQLGQQPGVKVESVCSKPCPPGFYKNLQTGGQEQKCCWVCVPCEANSILIDELTCRPCRLGYWPNKNKTVCDQIPIEFVKWTDTEAVVSIVFSCLGFLSTFFTAGVFVRYNDTPVVKSSTRELSYMILAGMTLSHATTFPILARPSVLSCSLSRVMPGLSFAMIYASLLTKTNRIARILAGSKKRFPSRKMRFMSGTAQVLMTLVLIGIEAGVAGAMLVLEPARPAFNYPTIDRAVLVCNSSPQGVVVPLAFDFFLIALCTLYAVKTRNVPENFNEAKFIGFAMYTTCVIWIAFVPIYFGSDSKIITMCVCVTLSGMVTLVFLFMPKLYIILVRPERNNRALFTTSKEIRCHIGTVASGNLKAATYPLPFTDSPRPNNVRQSWQPGDKTHLEIPNRDRCVTLYGSNSESGQNCNALTSRRNHHPSVRWQHPANGESGVAAGVQTDRSLLDALLEQKPRWLILSPSSLLKPTVRVREESLSEDDQSGQLKNITIRLGGSTTSTLSDTSDYFFEDDRSDQLKKSLSDCEAALLVRCLTHQTTSCDLGSLQQSPRTGSGSQDRVLESHGEDDRSDQLKKSPSDWEAALIVRFLTHQTTSSESQDRVWESHSEDDRSDQLKKSLSDCEAALLVRCLTHQTTSCDLGSLQQSPRTGSESQDRVWESHSEDDRSDQLKNITIRLGGSTTTESQDRVWESHSEDDRSDQLKKSLSDCEAALLVRCLTHQTTSCDLGSLQQSPRTGCESHTVRTTGVIN